MTHADELAAIGRRWAMNGLDLTFPFSLDTAAQDIRTLQAALDEWIKRNDETDARLLAAVEALRAIQLASSPWRGDMKNLRAVVENALAEIERKEARG